MTDRAPRGRTSRRRAGALAAALAGLGLGGCMTPPVAPLGEEVDPATLARDEQHLWKQAREMSYRLDHSGMRYEDPALDRYLTGVAEGLVGDQLAEAGLEPEVKVLSNPDMNAFAFPNGVVYVHTALLARMEDEAQLATLLSREYAHVIHRHALRKHRSDRNTGNLLAASGLALSGVKGGGNAKLMLQIGSMTSMGGYAHALEMTADREGLAMMDRVGYDLEQAPRTFEMTIGYLEEVGKQRAAPGLPFAMAKPLHVTNRIAAYRKLLAGEYAASVAEPDRIRNADVYRRHVNGATIHQAQLELDRGRFDSAAITIERALAVDDAQPAAWLILGEARERSAAAPDPAGAVEAYERALALDGGYAPAHRALGLLFYRDGRGDAVLGERREAARRHLERYLEIAPDARDAGYIRSYVSELRAAEDAGAGRAGAGDA